MRMLPKLVSDFPKADYEIRPVEQFRAASAVGRVVPGAVGRRQAPGNLLHQHLQPQSTAALSGSRLLSLHEASPGHHFQISIQQELTDLPRFRRFNGYVS
jgi:uncharacterized protein (DUF885 family)